MPKLFLVKLMNYRKNVEHRVVLLIYIAFAISS